jgi:polyisoprenyl-teichoic acid--peptidoglycan teichoic acid transferase
MPSYRSPVSPARAVAVAVFVPVAAIGYQRRWRWPVTVAAQLVPVATAAVPLLSRSDLVDVALDRRVLFGVVVATVCYAVSLLATIPTVVTSPARRWSRSTATAVLVAAAVAAAAVTTVGVMQIQVVDEVFVTAPVAVPSRPAPTVPPTVSSAATVPPSVVADTSTTTTVVTIEPPERFNVLLIGSDAGPGRYGARADSMNVVSIDESSGDVAVVGVPRNLSGAPTPAGFEPHLGPRFDELINAAHTWAAPRAQLVESVLGATDEPGWSFTAALVAETVGLRIDAWIAVDMAGFIEIVDALGGVDVYVPKSVPAPGNVAAGKHALPERFEAGWRRMDGTDALGYARSRSADSDYQRMGRQRCLLASLAAQRSTVELVAAWPRIAAAVGANVRTNLSPAKMADFVGRVGPAVDRTRVLALVPPLVPSSGFDPAAVRVLVAEFVAAAPPVTPPLSDTAGSVVPDRPPSSAVVSEQCVLRP